VPPFSTAPTAPGTAMMFGEDIAKVVLDLPAETAPGREFAYANGNAQLAGMVLERATGMRYADWLSRTLWRPIGAGDAAVWLDRPGGHPHFFCCLQATARDWLRVGELIRERGRAGGRQVVPAGWIGDMATPSATNPNYGLQLWLGSPHVPARRYNKTSPLVVPAKAPFAAADVLFLDGAGGQRVYVVRSAGLTVVRIGKPTVTWDDSQMINDLLRGLAR
jgi:CubicO group peptidase (beta-lactamase class C family)